MITEVIGFTKDKGLKLAKATLYTNRNGMELFTGTLPLPYLDFPRAGYVIQFA